ncbi:RNA dependent RNA polymerase-domain-containing protein [Cytidiella melzeri]|nr:RNA dependent RNA polymerase-domain-containing protein [Cytidiella melzeri]
MGDAVLELDTILRPRSSLSSASTESYPDGYELCLSLPEHELNQSQGLSQSQSGPCTQYATDAPVYSKRKREESPDIGNSESTSPAPPSKLFKSSSSADSFSTSSKEIHTTFDDFDEHSPYVVAYDTRFSSFFTGMPVGFWWEVARLLSNGTPKDNLSLSDLKAYANEPNVIAAPAVSRVVEDARRKDLAAHTQRKLDPTLEKAFAQERAAKAPWEELDREEEHESRAIKARDVYFQDECKDWYGGKIHFTAKVTKNSPSTSLEPYQLTLETPSLGSSNRFTRRFGSKRFIRVRLHEKVFSPNSNAALERFFKRPFVIFTRVFRAFYAKEGSVFLVQTNEVYQETLGSMESYRIQPSTSAQNPLDMSLLDFLRWHNPLKLNSDQHMAKWASRFALGLSNSVPSVRIAKEDLLVIDDIVADAYVGKTKVPSEFTMTDGCGLANGNLFSLLCECFRWVTYPTAVQVRINGAKGLLTIHPDHASPTPDKRPIVWIRKYQQKIVYAESDDDVAHYTVDFLRSSHMKTPAQLSSETIINLAENGVPATTFRDMMKESFARKVEMLTLWDGPNGLSKLRENISREGNVVSARLARQHAGSARAKGYIYEDYEEPVDSDCIADDDLALMEVGRESSTAWWDDPISGQPSSLEETCMGLLDSGFSPSTCSLLRDKLLRVAKKSLTSLATKFHIKVQLSCTAFVIPDPVGVLNPGECQIKFSTKRVQGPDGVPTNMILGPLLLTRHPCKVPSDIQKATGVLRPELRNYDDVIVVSTKGHIVNGERLDCHLASMTGGGDYDGDLMSAYWEPSLLEHFKCADKSFAKEPASVSEYVSKAIETAEDFRIRVPPDTSIPRQISELQSFLLAQLRDPAVVGTYSTYWENSIYVNGYDHPETVRLAYIFCSVLDGIKTGVSIKREKQNCDRNLYSKQPDWKQLVGESKKKKKTVNSSNLAPPKRATHLPTFIMDVLKEEVKKEHSAQLAVIESRLANSDEVRRDEDLVRPWLEFEHMLTKVQAERNEFVAQARRLIEADYVGIETRARMTQMMTEGSSSETLASMLKAIETHVRKVFDDWKKRTAKTDHNSNPDPSKSSNTFTDMDIRKRQDILRSLSLSFATDPDPRPFCSVRSANEIARLKASYAYIVGCEKRKYRFPFDVAYRQLCAIKAQAVSNGREKSVASTSYETFYCHKRFINGS